MNKKQIKIPLELYRFFQGLDAEDAGKVIQAIFEYSIHKKDWDEYCNAGYPLYLNLRDEWDAEYDS